MRVRFLLTYREHGVGDEVDFDDLPVADILRQRGILEFIEDKPAPRTRRREKAAHFTGADS